MSQLRSSAIAAKDYSEQITKLAKSLDTIPKLKRARKVHFELRLQKSYADQFKYRQQKVLV